MKIQEILQEVRPAFSFEFFPPKDDDGFDQLFQTIDRLKSWNPAFVSVTYGAGGSTRSKTIDLVGRIKNEIGLESMAHLTCVGHSSDEICSVLKSLQEQGIDNVLALRGDPPQGETNFVKPENGFGFASELVGFTRDKFPFCIGVAGYPEGHPECPDHRQGLEHVKNKIIAGGSFIVTQLFFDNKVYFDFVKNLKDIEVDVPVIPGIMPILNLKQIKRFTKMCGATVPADLLARLESVQDDPEAVREIGIDHATAQCENLLSQGAPGIHFYTLNRSRATLSVLERLKSISIGS
ncbi:MAG TPA: methylenetetrahydrofolate reductase [NAD(P)H] [Nitrospina sp.]|jgi:methylenetetrahydrofolate reductase (NADPH)|nr:methylenetetrahydrofolate reductase [NAD(P)H] [Nitrospinota bacterium]MDP6336014.1 methylenetetrahydrofolate reductase [NAD(P)H] [Nitrospinaceae bacterium]MDP7148385.1 methylenetetrahydrofolate reductase [NAD(P)H] [Nitrospinaceae bacterium]HAX46990.1 methylenetetrahydrofolate reductase [NAD(P)H] [Nitrospina sp.]|tara:strand:+ start:11003 stop:11881 length:879 start_codon:yes stop_codon:yes gene_type:complete